MALRGEILATTKHSRMGPNPSVTRKAKVKIRQFWEDSIVGKSLGFSEKSAHLGVSLKFFVISNCSCLNLLGMFRAPSSLLSVK